MPRRAYHNLHHIASLLEFADRFEERIENREAVRFAIWFHDAIYETSRKDNEMRSAEFAIQSLGRLQAPRETTALVQAMIHATHTHSATGLCEDGRLFLDFDLSILGSDEAEYEKYARAIREEYWWVPSLVYKRERRKVLENFLQRERIFFTTVMFDLCESPARRNIEKEISTL